MTCVEFWVWFGSGVVIVPLLGWLKGLPKIGAVVAQWAWLLAPALSAILPQIAEIVQPHCASVDPLLWSAIYAALTYLVSQLVFWVNKQTVKIGR
jgi:hypothetical protein